MGISFMVASSDLSQVPLELFLESHKLNVLHLVASSVPAQVPLELHTMNVPQEVCGVASSDLLQVPNVIMPWRLSCILCIIASATETSFGEGI